MRAPFDARYIISGQTRTDSRQYPVVNELTTYLTYVNADAHTHFQ